MLEPFIVAFVLALISEIADKTQLVILGLALQYKSPLKVFVGALTAHAVMDGLAILVGTYFAFSVPSVLVKNIIGLLFIILGLWSFGKLYLKKHTKKKKERLPKTPFIASFLLVLLSEFGDKTQIASGLLAAKYTAPLSIFIGFVLALMVAIGFNVFIGSKVAKKIPRKAIKIVTAILFILFGIFTLVF